ncbi:amylase-binding protein [Streptococcus parasanguinis]|uniref:amylase-binding adhesin AbpA n=1 Tax=Streptococcus parasanguinis TaxID=1318 RepID=UPI0012BCA4BA|nr:amylase-binding adhesin AbpA [Streptococcus parasanguinis]MTR54859.1 amylase-binding protein [Streptococcus parasanguinis]MTR56848.1 amylase-binding protein [Streptococcus parasanguinis]MTR61698.1 amylase-binding protein [Streptococcus parasanguinis]MTR71339.1 amylase-binding protein [Streptococcus parasanguinis]MTS03775.1 amylase-binding protein [Streptococcus parasanguinis]
MKKVLLSSVAALAVFAAAAPAFASDNSYSSNALIQKHYVSERDIADEANTQVAAHEAEINAEAENYPTVVAARQALEAYGSGHLYGDYVAKLEAARTEARNVVRNKYVANLQDQYRAAAQREGKYWNDVTGVQDNKTKDMRDQEDKALNHGGSADAADAAGANGQATNEAKSNENKGGDAAKAGKAGSKQAGKALPKTSAVK